MYSKLWRGLREVGARTPPVFVLVQPRTRAVPTGWSSTARFGRARLISSQQTYPKPKGKAGWSRTWVGEARLLVSGSVAGSALCIPTTDMNKHIRAAGGEVKGEKGRAVIDAEGEREHLLARSPRPAAPPLLVPVLDPCSTRRGKTDLIRFCTYMWNC